MTKYNDIVPTVASGGIIRFGPDGIYIHENETHDSVGIRSISIDEKGRIVVYHSAPGSIVTMSANADETLVTRGITLGCSGGGGRTVIVVARFGRALDLNKSDDYKLVSGSYCNAWLFWLHRAG